MTATPLDGLINDLASFQYRPLDFVYWPSHGAKRGRSWRTSRGLTSGRSASSSTSKIGCRNTVRGATCPSGSPLCRAMESASRR